jgi:hypothetical protein
MGGRCHAIQVPEARDSVGEQRSRLSGSSWNFETAIV